MRTQIKCSRTHTSLLLIGSPKRKRDSGSLLTREPLPLAISLATAVMEDFCESKSNQDGILSPVVLTRNAGAVQRLAVTRTVAKAFCSCFWNEDDDDDPCNVVLVVSVAGPAVPSVNQRGDLPTDSHGSGVKPTTTALLKKAVRSSVTTTPRIPEIRIMDQIPCARADGGGDNRSFPLFKR